MRLIVPVLAALLWTNFAAASPLFNAQRQIADPVAVASLSPTERQELTAFYAARNFSPVWSVTNAEDQNQLQGFFASIEAVAAFHGLEPERYLVAEMRDKAKGDIAGREPLEWMISVSLLRLAHDLHGDELDLSRLYSGWEFHRAPQDVPSLLNAAVSSGTLSAFLNKEAPHAKAYYNLVRALKTYRDLERKGGWREIAAVGTLTEGARGNRVMQLRARLAAEGYLTEAEVSSDEFDESLSNAVETFQSNNGLSETGKLDARTLAALNVPVSARIQQIRANMERWRHIPDDFPFERQVVVNIPDFTVTITDENREIYHGIVVVGRTDRQTPFVDSAVENVVINPAWHVPVKLARQDILPKLRRDPYYLEKIGIEIAGRDEDPSGININWHNVRTGSFPYQLRQRPGEKNSLGQVKLNFDNPFDVYMHGTPHQELFDRSERAFSSGCVRLQEPERVAELVLGAGAAKGHWSEDHINEAIDTGRNFTITLLRPMPVSFLYWTVFADKDGHVNFRKDIYGYDSRLMAAWHQPKNFGNFAEAGTGSQQVASR